MAKYTDRFDFTPGVEVIIRETGVKGVVTLISVDQNFEKFYQVRYTNESGGNNWTAFEADDLRKTGWRSRWWGR